MTFNKKPSTLSCTVFFIDSTIEPKKYKYCREPVTKLLKAVEARYGQIHHINVYDRKSGKFEYQLKA